MHFIALNSASFPCLRLSCRRLCRRRYCRCCSCSCSSILLFLLLLLLTPRLAKSSFIRRQEDGKGRDLSGYGSRDSLVSSSREKEEGSVYRRTRSDLSAELISRANADTTNKEDRKSSRSSKWVLVYLNVCY